MGLSVRESFISSCLSALPPEDRQRGQEELAQGFARAKVRNLAREDDSFVPLPGEIDYERRRLSNPHNQTWGLLYDGFKLMNLLKGLIPPEERGLDHIHVVFTNQLFGTWEDSDRRYHARVSVYGFPDLISTTGLVEAPAKPREYYFLKQHYTALGMPDAAVAGLAPSLEGRFIDHEDERLTEVMKGYVLQALFYHLTGDPFCPDKACRLYNAHWQEEVIRAQLEGPYELCPRHQGLLEELRR